MPCVQGGSIGNTSISLYATVSDRDSGNLSTEYQIFKTGQSTPTATMTIPANNGRVATWVVPDASLPDGSYTWKARTTDQDGAQSAWSQTCKFTVDRARPAKAPKINSTVFPDGKNGWPTNTGKARQEGDFVLSANGVKDVTWYGYYTDWAPEVKSATVAAGTSFTAKLTPPGAGPHFVYAFTQDAAGNRSDTTVYPFYAARTATADVPHDLNGDGFRDIWSNDLFGSLLTYSGQGNGKFSATVSSGKSFAGAQVATTGDWDGDGYNDLMTLEQPAGVSRKSLWTYGNLNGQGAAGNPIEMTAEDGNNHWSDAEQIIAPGDLNKDGVPDVLVKQGNKLWAYVVGISGKVDDRSPALVGGTDWDKYTVVAPGDLNKDGVPDLWLRDNASGDILRTYGKKSKEEDQVVDLATWGTQTRTKVGSGVTKAAYPSIGSAGDLSGDGVTDLWARQTDNTMVGWQGKLSSDGATVSSFTNLFEIDGVPGARIPAGTTLASGQEFSSGNSKLVMQADGNLVLFTKDKKPIWATNTDKHPGALARMQSDGNLVVYEPDGKTELWSSKTATPYSYAVLHPRGVLVIYNASGQGLWTSGSQSRPDYNGDGYTDVVGRTRDGDLYVYPGTGRTGTNSFANPVLIGNGWSYHALGFGDINGDGRTDVIARDHSGDLWLYPHIGGIGTQALGSRNFMGNGWWPNEWTTVRYADLNGDYKIDIFGRHITGGNLFVYPNTTTNGTVGFGAPVFSGNGFWNGEWNPYATDLDSNGAAEPVGITNTGDLYDFTPDGGRTLIGTGWNGYDVIL